MEHLAAPSRSSWLSLVAETAGVAGAGIARVVLAAPQLAGPVRAVVQIHDHFGQVVGATHWYGEGCDLRTGATVDLGYDVLVPSDLKVVAWIDRALDRAPALLALPPREAVARDYDPRIALRLNLDAQMPGPARPDQGAFAASVPAAA